MRRGHNDRAAWRSLADRECGPPGAQDQGTAEGEQQTDERRWP